MSRFRVKQVLYVLLGVFLALALAACSSGGGSSTAGPTDPPTDPTDPPTDPTDPVDPHLAQARTDAAEAATDAATEATKAAASADKAATAATDGFVALQTDKVSDTRAAEAKAAADAAQASADTAKEQSDAAAAADSVRAGLVAALAAEAAQAAAEGHAAEAESKYKSAMSEADTEIKSSGANRLSVGGVEIKLDGIKRRTTDKAYGLLDDTIQTSSARDEYGRANNTRRRNVGSVYDSHDDAHRLVVMDRYRSSESRNHFTTAGNTRSIYDPDLTAPADHSPMTASDDGMITVPAAAWAGSSPVTGELKSAGTNNFLHGDNDKLSDEPVELFYIPSGVADDSGTAGIDESKIFLQKEKDSENMFKTVSVITVTVDTTPNWDNFLFGLWTALNEDGNAPTNLGIGLVHMTEDGTRAGDTMPNVGSARYNGYWVGMVQGKNSADVTQRNANATVRVDFEEDKDHVTVELSNLANMKGQLSGDTFSGDSLESVSGTYMLSNADKFTGSLSGAFFGSRAKEVGGVFSFKSELNEKPEDKPNDPDTYKDGAFVGSFGARR